MRTTIDGIEYDIELPDKPEVQFSVAFWKWFEPIAYRINKNGEYYLGDNGKTYKAISENADYTKRVWIMAEIPTPTQAQLDAIGIQASERPEQYKTGDLIWTEERGLYRAGKIVGSTRYRFILTRVEKQKPEVMVKRCSLCRYEHLSLRREPCSLCDETNSRFEPEPIILTPVEPVRPCGHWENSRGENHGLDSRPHDIWIDDTPKSAKAEPVRGSDGKLLPQTTDAMAWVFEWMDTIKVHPSIPTDEGAMLAWFSNAIMAGWNEAQRRAEKKHPPYVEPPVNDYDGPVPAGEVKHYSCDGCNMNFPRPGPKYACLVCLKCYEPIHDDGERKNWTSAAKAEERYSIEKIANKCANVLYDKMLALDSKNGGWIVSSNSFLPANVVCDHAGISKFKTLLKDCVSGVLSDPQHGIAAVTKARQA